MRCATAGTLRCGQLLVHLCSRIGLGTGDCLLLPCQGLDYTLQSGDTWFFVEGTALRPLSELITTYHNCVGMNTVMELVR